MKRVDPKPQPRATARMLNVDDVATQLDISLKTVRRMIANGELRVHRIGRSIRISEAEFQSFISTRRC
jgi:excisionase family DNA binding protein